MEALSAFPELFRRNHVDSFNSQQLSNCEWIPIKKKKKNEENTKFESFACEEMTSSFKKKSAV